MVKYFAPDANSNPVNANLVQELAEDVKPLYIVDDQLCYDDNKNERHLCRIVNVDVTKTSEWLADKIPFPSFNIVHSGHVRKACEVQALYSCVMVVFIIKDKIFKNESEETLDHYDYVSMVFKEEDMSFLELLNRLEKSAIYYY